LLVIPACYLTGGQRDRGAAAGRDLVRSGDSGSEERKQGRGRRLRVADGKAGQTNVSKEETFVFLLIDV